MSVIIKFKRLTATAKIPAYQTAHAAGMDLVAGYPYAGHGARQVTP